MKRRIFSYFVRVLAAAIILTTMLVTLLTYSIFKAGVERDLEIDARMLAGQTDSMKSVSAEMAELLRVTVIRPDGTVQYDNRADAVQMDNHMDRPEIDKALRTGEGQDVRQSKTIGKSTFYYAMRLADGRVLRVAKESSSIWSVYLRALPLIALVSLLMFGLCALVAGKLTQRLIEPIGRMTQSLGDADVSAEYPELTPVIRTIRSQHEEILRSANMRVEFTANVSHELKTPLTSISGYAELIESGMATDQMAREFARKIHKSASRLLTLINDIIRLSQMDAPEHEIERENVDLAQVAGGVVEQLRLNAEKMNVDFRMDLRPAIVSADRRMMEELIYNLCDNAIRYNVYGGSVRVEVHPLKGSVRLVVQDTGIGISEEHRERVFERFYRVDKSRSKATGGTGLGLAIVKHIAAKHGAQIAMQSELGRGTRIAVTFERIAV